MKLFEDAGPMAMGTRIRMLAERISQDAGHIYEDYETRLQPKWFPVFYILSKKPGSSITSLAEDIGHSHASVSKIVTEMSKAKLTVEKTSPEDRRRTLVSLSPFGKQIAAKIERQYTDVSAAIDEVLSQSTHNLWAAVEEWEYLLGRESLRDRVARKRKERESMSVTIESYQPKYKEAFRKLNEQWITTHFELEKPDRDALGHPKEYILDRGGYIFVAVLEGQPVGVCALLKRDELDDIESYELAKMAVAPEARGKNIGYLLGRAAIDKAASLQAKRVFLESNTILKPAIKLYEKLGFKKIAGHPTPYARCNIQMLLELEA